MPEWNRFVREGLRDLHLAPSREAEIVAELALHLEATYAEALAAGRPESEALAAAARELSDWKAVTSDLARAERTVPPALARRWTELQSKTLAGGKRPWLLAAHLALDVRYGIRMLRKNRGFTLVAVLTLAMGIGASTAIFSVVNALLLQPLPFGDADRLVALNTVNRQIPSQRGGVSYLDLTDWQRQSETLEAISGVSPSFFDLSGEGEPERIPGELVSGDYFTALGISAQVGRVLQLEDDHLPLGEPVTVLSHRLWHSRFGGDSAIVGKPIVLNGSQLTVVGIAPESFSGHSGDAQLWVPVTFVNPTLQRNNQLRPARWIQVVVARRAPRAALPAVQAEMDLIAQRLEQQYPRTNAGRGVLVVPLAERLVGNLRRTVLVVFATVCLVLLIASANIANLLLVRATERERELALRRALGAGRVRLIWQLLTESVLLSLVGGTAGVLLAFWGIPLLPAFFSGIPGFVRFELDGVVLGFTLLVSLVVGVVFGLAPALRWSRRSLVESLKEGGRNRGMNPRSQKLHNLLVMFETALALVLLIGSGLLLRSLEQLRAVDLGFEPAQVLTLRFAQRDTRFSPAEVMTFDRQLLERLGNLPGIEAAGLGLHIPLDGFNAGAILNLEGDDLDDPNSGFQTWHHAASPDYFRVLGIRLLRGRTFSDRDSETSLPVIVLSESAARRFWPGQDPLGRKVRFQREGRDTPWMEVVGVVGDAHFSGIASSPADYLDVYQPISQSLFYPVRFKAVVVRTRGPATALIPAVRGAVHSLDPGLPVFAVAPLERVVADAMKQHRATSLLMGLFSLLALALATVGLYGMISYSVTQRNQEIGIRIALGARPSDIFRLVVGKGMLLTSAGLAAGLLGALFATRYLENLLYRVGSRDLATFLFVSFLLAAVALLACYFPARRATKVEPITALRCE